MIIGFYENKQYIYITVESESSQPLSWEELQTIKDIRFSDLDFIEVYPKENEIINKANVRHLIHIKGFKPPYLSDLEMEFKEI